MKKTPQQIRNLKDALVWWKTVPKKNVDLNDWRDSGTPPYTCSTICCFGGWCAVQPKLVAQGVRPGGHGAPVTATLPYSWQVASEIFGESHIFACRGNHPVDEGFNGSDHVAVSRRIRHALKNLEQC